MDNNIFEYRIKELVEALNEASDAYYNGKAEIMTDKEWDSAFDELKSLEEETGIILPDSPTQNVSADTYAGQKVEHEFKALSLAKTKKVEDLVKWSEGRPIWLSWKLDGLTIVGTYDDGQLTRLVTRGNGTVGTDITRLADSINGVPKKIDEKGHFVIRGEAVISYEDFEKFCEESEETYANPRNLASGSLSLKDAEEVKKRNIKWVPFTLVYTENDIVSWGERMEYLDKLGFSSVDRERINKPEDIASVIDKWSKRVTDGKAVYPVDGLVITYDDTEYAATGSVTGHHATRAGYAFKWQDEARETVLDHIEWSCAAKTITPVAVFEPVELEGTIVKRASLSNVSECRRLGIGDKGSVISIYKANKIIPRCSEVIKKQGELNIPDTCPVCGSKAILNVSDTGTETLMCSNPECTAKNISKFSRFVSKGGMDIDGLSTQTLKQFVNMGWIKNFADIYSLSDHQDELKEMEGFGEKSVNNLLTALENSKNPDADKFLFGLCIPMCGPDVAKRMLGRYSLKELIESTEIASTEGNYEVYSDIDGIGPEKSKAFVSWFANEDNRKMVDSLLEIVNVKEPEKIEKGARCEGLVFVITGNVYKYKNRDEVKAYIESQGGKVTGSVSAKTSYLINNDIESTSGKNKKAKELGVPIISEDDFISRFSS